MGFNVSLLAYADDISGLDVSRPVRDRGLAAAVVGELFPRTRYVEQGTIALDGGGFPSGGALNVGAFESGLLIATRGAHLYNPSKLHRRYLKGSRGRTVVLLTQRSSNDMFAYARWVDGGLVRSISLNPIGKVWENIGVPEPFEVPFWNGEHPAESGYPLPFHPLELSDAALRCALGLVYEGPAGPGLTSPDDVLLRAYRRQDG